MKTLVLRNKKTLQLSDVSVPTDMVTVTSKYAEIDALDLNKENVEGAELDGVVLETIFVGVDTHCKDEGGNVEVHIRTREKTLEEKFTGSQEEQNAVLDELMGVVE